MNKLIMAGITGMTLAACQETFTGPLPAGSRFAIIEIDGSAAPEGASIEFTEDGFHGRGPCNLFNGQLDRQGDGMSFGPAAMTRMACLDGRRAEAEAGLVAALDAITRAEAGSDGQVRLLDGDGRARLLLGPAAALGDGA